MAPISAPVASNFLTRTTPRGVVVMSGTDWLESINISNGTANDGEVIAEITFSPLSMVGTHISTVSAGFERFKFTRLVASVITGAPTSVAGRYLVGITPDVEQHETNNMKQYVRALPGSVGSPWWQSTSTVYDCTKSDAYYFTNLSMRQSYRTQQAKLYLVVDGNPRGVDGTLTLSIQLDWTLELSEPVAPVRGSMSKSFDLPETTLKLYDDNKYWYVPADSPAYNNFWDNAQYDEIYICQPPIVNTAFGNIVQAVRVSKTSAGSHVVVPFKTYDTAKKAGQSPQAGDVGFVTGVKLVEATVNATKVVSHPATLSRPATFGRPRVVASPAQEVEETYDWGN